MTIGALTIILFFSRFLTILFDFGNAYFDLWFAGVNFLLVTPIFIAVIFYVNFWIEDTKESRRKLWIGMILVLVSLFLLTLWATIYVSAFYPYPNVFIGSGPEEKENIRHNREFSNYMEEEKGGYILAEWFWFVMEGALFGYFLYVCWLFDDSYYPKEEEKKEEEKKDDEKKPEENKDAKKE